MNVISIDPGMKGAIACIGPHRIKVADLPITDTGLDKYLNGRGLYDILLDWCPVDERCILVVEDVRVRNSGNDGQRNTVHSQTALMRARGIIEGVASVARLEITWCTPQKWKRHFKLGRDTEDETQHELKEKSRQMALQMFPSMADALNLKKHENRAEALLMARWGQATQL